MQSATSIQFISDRAQKISGSGGDRIQLTVDFRVFKKGPAHMAGIMYSPNFWGSRQEALASFQRFEGDSEVWRTIVTVPGHNQIEYVIFCDDFRGVDTVPRIYNTNRGETFRPVAS